MTATKNKPWKRSDMETFYAFLVISEGGRSPVVSPYKGPVIRCFDCFCGVTMNKLLDKRSSCPLFDAIVLMWRQFNELQQNTIQCWPFKWFWYLLYVYPRYWKDVDDSALDDEVLFAPHVCCVVFYWIVLCCAVLFPYIFNVVVPHEKIILVKFSYVKILYFIIFFND